MSQIAFGPAAVFGERIENLPLATLAAPRPEIAGQGPRQFGIVQKVDVNWSYTDKPLYGGLQFPIAMARGQGKIAGKMSHAQLNLLLVSDLFYGLTAVNDQLAVETKEQFTVAGGVTVANAATFLDDLGVTYRASGNRFNRISGAVPTAPLVGTPLPLSGAGTYSVDLETGSYTFDGADTGVDVLIAYAYSTPGTGYSVNITNEFSGITPAFKAYFYQAISPGPPGSGTQQQPLALKLNACVAEKLGLPNNSSVDAWMISDVDFMAYTDAAGDIGVLSMIQP